MKRFDRSDPNLELFEHESILILAQPLRVLFIARTP